MALAQQDWCPCKKRKRHQGFVGTEKWLCKYIEQAGGHLQAKEEASRETKFAGTLNLDRQHFVMAAQAVNIVRQNFQI